MYILLAAATALEIQPTIDFLEGAPGSPPQASSLRTLHETSVLTTGIGSLAATHALMRSIGRRRPDLVIQAGIAGGFYSSSAAAPGAGDVFVIREEILADLGVWEDEKFRSLFDLRLAGRNDPPFSGGRLVNPHQELLALSGLRAVTSVTVNEITTDPRMIHWYQQNYAPVVESMEGGALHYTCLQEKIPFLQIRSISNPIGERDKAKWNIGLAVQNLNDGLIALFRNLDNTGTA